MNKSRSKVSLVVTSIITAIIFICSGIFIVIAKKDVFMPAITRFLKSFLSLYINPMQDSIYSGWIIWIITLGIIAWLIYSIIHKRVLTGILGTLTCAFSLISLTIIIEFKQFLINSADFNIIEKLGIILFAIALCSCMIISALTFLRNFNNINKNNFDNISQLNYDYRAKKFTNISMIIVKIILILSAVIFNLIFILKPSFIAQHLPQLIKNTTQILAVTRWSDNFLIIGTFCSIISAFAIVKLFLSFKNKRSPAFPITLLITLLAFQLAFIDSNTLSNYLNSDNTLYAVFAMICYLGIAILVFLSIISLLADEKMELALTAIENKETIVSDIKENIDIINQKEQTEYVTDETACADVTDEEIAPPTCDNEEVNNKQENIIEEQTIEQVVKDNNNIELNKLKKLNMPKKTFKEKLSSCDDPTVQENYNALVKSFSEHGYKVKECNYFITVREGRDTVAKINIIGKTLKVYLALNPINYKETVYHQQNMSSSNKYAMVPMMVKVRSPLSLKKTFRLIEELKTNRY